MTLSNSALVAGLCPSQFGVLSLPGKGECRRSAYVLTVDVMPPLDQSLYGAKQTCQTVGRYGGDEFLCLLTPLKFCF
jgi:hypothetical protein